MPAPPNLEQLVDAALVRIADADGATLGTGFVVSGDGRVLTCDHVVAGRDHLVLQFADGRRDVWTEGQVARFPDVDVALLEGRASHAAPLPLIAPPDPPERFWTKGFQFQQRGLTAAVPVRGAVTGRTRIEYAGTDREYRVDVLVLNQGDLDQGLSGAPLLDPASGAAYGIVVAHFPNRTDIRGFAVAFSSATGIEQGLSSLLDENDKECPRFGRYVNALGAQELCRAQVQAAVDRLRSERLYLPEFYCARTGLTEAVQRFAAQRARICPLFGPAGVGKTTWLVNHACEMSRREPALLLRGLDITADHDSIADLVDATIAGARDGDWREPPRAADLPTAVAQHDGDLWLLLDGLNECRATSRHLIDVWVPQTIDWIRHRRVRLLVTCREELWQLMLDKFPEALVFRADEPEPRLDESASRRPTIGIRLAEFTEAEAGEAMRAYGLRDLDRDRLTSLPLALRLIWELMRERMGTTPTPSASMPDLGTIIDRLVARISQRVAVVCGVQSPRRVRELVDAIAAEMWRARADQIISLGALPPAFASAGAWLDALVDEHLLIARGNGYRFAFDDVAEYLQSAQVDLSEPAAAQALFSEAAARRSWGIVSHAFGRLAASGVAGALPTAVGHLTEWLRGEPRGGVHLGFAVARRISGYAGSDESVKDIVRVSGTVHRMTTVVGLVTNSGQLGLDIDALLELARLLLPGEGSYPWRAKDWREPSRRLTSAVLESVYSVGGIVGKAAEQDASRTVATLFDWLPDSTNLGDDRDPEATIHDFACACLFYLAPIAFDTVCEGAAARIAQPDMASLLGALATVHWERMRGRVSEWTDRPERHQAAAETVLRAWYTPESAIERRELAAILVRVFDRAAEPMVRYTVAGALASEPHLAERVLPSLLEGYVAGAVSAFALTPYLRSHGKDLERLFRARLSAATDADWWTGGKAQTIVGALGNAAREPASLGVATELLRSSFSPPSAFAIGRALEDILHHVDAEVAERTGVLALCSKVIEESPDEAAVQCLLYIAYPTWGEDFPASPELRRIFECAPMPVQRFRNVCEQVSCAARRRGAEAFGWLEPYRQRVGQPGWDEAVMSAILWDRGAFAECAERGWRSASPETLTPMALAYLRARDAGAESETAAIETLHHDEADGQ